MTLQTNYSKIQLYVTINTGTKWCVLLPTGIDQIQTILCVNSQNQGIQINLNNNASKYFSLLKPLTINVCIVKFIMHLNVI